MPLRDKFNKQDIIILDPEAKSPYWPFSFGVAKAKVIIDRIFDIEKWYESLPKGPINDIRATQMDITPEINHGKKFVISKYKAKLILKYKGHIADFIQQVEMEQLVKISGEKNKIKNSFKRYR